MTGDPALLRVAARFAADYAALSGVRAVVLGGSLATGRDDGASDIDLYVYADPDPDIADRRRISAGGREIEIDNRYWENGDEWVDRATGMGIDVTYRTPGWVEAELDRVLDRHQASTGYTTAIWANVAAGVPLSDPSGWYGDLRRRAAAPYPEPLRAAIVAKNLPLLRAARGAYRGQVVKAIARGDLVSVNHRVAALLASVFDIVFAVNRRPHPGEKRQVAIAEATCPDLPDGFAVHVAAVLASAGAGSEGLLVALDRLIDEIERLSAGDEILAAMPRLTPTLGSSGERHAVATVDRTIGRTGAW